MAQRSVHLDMITPPPRSERDQMNKMRSGKAARRTRRLAWFAFVMMMFSFALVATIMIVRTENKPALPGVFVDAPQSTQYCFEPTSRYGFCF